MVTLRVNGKTYQVDAEPGTPLLWVLRDSLGLIGTKYGCGIAQCGACTVHVDGRAIRSCVLPLSAVLNNDITTIEGLAADQPASRPARLDGTRRATVWLLPGRPDHGCSSLAGDQTQPLR